MTVKSCEKVEKSQVELTIEVNAAEFEAAVEKAYQKMRRKISVPGFRPGKAPRKMIERMYGAEVFFEEAINIAFPEAYEAAAEQEKLQIVGYPTVEMVGEVTKDGFTFKATTPVYPEVTLGEYKGLTVEVEPTAVSDDEVLKQIRANAGSDILEEVTEGTVEEGDTANIDYEGKLDGEAFEGGTAKDTDLEIGSGTFIPGFEDGLVGVKIGDTVDLPLTFPENYTEELAGKDVVFTVTVNSVKRMPELTDDLVNQITDGEYTDVASYKESVRKDLEDAKAASRPSEINNSLLTQIAATSTIKEYPQELVDYAANNMKNYYKQQAESSSMEFADFLSTYFSMDEDTFNEQVDLVVKQNLRAELYLKAIAEAEDIELTDEEYEAKCEEYAENYGYDSVEKFKSAYTETEIRLSALEDKVLEFLSDNATVVEKSEDETEASSEAEASTEATSEDGTEAAVETETEAATEAATDAE